MELSQNIKRREATPHFHLSPFTFHLVKEKERLFTATLSFNSDFRLFQCAEVQGVGQINPDPGTHG